MNIAILTLYYKNRNFGGLLQAYATPKFYNLFDNTEAYQLNFHPKIYNQSFGFINNVKRKGIRIILKQVITKKFTVKKTSQRFTADKSEELNKRITLYDNFANFEIKNYSKLISKKEILNMNNIFDAYIIGSDQVWNPKWHNDPYYLTFAPDDKLKVAYAASMGVSEISDEVANKIIPLIERFDYVSVREKSAKDLINRYTDKEVTVVSDPVLLLNQDDWNEVAVSPISDKSYVYTYLLGDRKDNRDITTKIAKDLKLPLVTVPYIHLRYNDYDKSFGDIQLNEVGPAEFVGLIRDSKMVVTDSFHAFVFSLIYNKKFVALKRNLDTETGSMNSRITDLLEEMGLSDRIVESQDEITDEFLSKEIDFTYANKVIKEKKIISIEFLKKAFTGTEMEQSLTECLEKLKEES